MTRPEHGDDPIELEQTLPDGGDRPPGSELAAGERLGRFIVLEKIGQGGMGTVYAAYDPDLDRRVAIKLLRPERAGSDDEARARLQREAKAMAKLRHPHVVSVHEVGTHRGDTFVAMEYVDGENLRGALARLRAESPLPWQRAVELFAQAARGLAAAHAAGLVHRDFKPDNALVGEDGRVQVTDFGLVAARAPAAPEGASSALDEPLTQHGDVLGTPIYMPPEQHRGEPTDPRSDQFALCVALYEALYGQLPFAGATRESYVAAMLANEVRPSPSGSPVPAWVYRVLKRGLSADADRRFASMDELLTELAYDPEQDRSVGWRTRRLLAAGFGVVWTVTPLVLHQTEAPLLRLGPSSFVAASLAWTAVILVLGLWARETLERTAYNLALARGIAFVFIAQSCLAAGAWLLEADPVHIHVLLIFLWFVAAGYMTIAVDARFRPSAIGYLAAFLLAAALPDLRHFAMSASNLVTMINAVWVFSAGRRPRRRAGPG